MVQDSRLLRIESLFRELHEKRRAFDIEESALPCREISQYPRVKSEITRQQTIIDSLDFDSRLDRQDAIVDAHSATFDWALRNLQPGTSASNLSRWLETGKGVFWVSGNPGSGKSTLMKYLVGNVETRRILHNWAHPGDLIIAGHYFWCRGTSIQKSHKGLLQTLLFDIFRQCPQLISKACLPRWNNCNANSLRRWPWTMTELLSTIENIVKSENIGQRFCFFIDGIDEYEGDHIEICQSLIELSGSSYLKLCVSSRSWNIFEDRLGTNSNQKLYIHDLTRRDIFRYSRTRLTEHPRWVTIGQSEEWTSNIAAEITERSKGVFLWVSLVIASLREGLNNDDTFHEFRLRLDSLPVDLEEYFTHILESIDPVYHQKMATVFQTVLRLPEPYELSFYSLQDEEYCQPGHGLQTLVRALNDMEIAPVELTRTHRRLNALGGGLLQFSRGKLDFLHRTVADFFQTGKVTKFLASRITPGVFLDRINFGTLIPWLACFSERNDKRFQESVVNLSLELSSGSDELQMMSEIFNTFLDLLKKRWLSRTQSSGDLDEAILAEALLKWSMVRNWEMHLYLPLALSRERFFFSKCQQMPLHTILNLTGREGSKRFSSLKSNKWFNLLKVLLEYGEDPNACIDSSHLHKISPWSQWFTSLLGDGALIDAYDSGAVLLLLKHGADPNAYCPGTLSPLWQAFFFQKFKGCFEFRTTYLDILHHLLRTVELGLVNKISTESAWAVFCRFMRELRTHNKDQLQLRAQATKVLIERAHQMQHPVGVLLETVRLVFPPQLAEPLVNLMLSGGWEQRRHHHRSYNRGQTSDHRCRRPARSRQRWHPRGRSHISYGNGPWPRRYNSPYACRKI